MPTIRNSLVIVLSSLFMACKEQPTNLASASNPTATPSAVVADSFVYPIGKTATVTQKKDKDEWFNAQDFGENSHLGEDWNMNTGGDTDCGQPVFAIANGVITFADDAGVGWGNVVIIEHTLASGEKIESLYGHMQEILKTKGEVMKREQIGKVGNANGRYLCHLHLEIRTSDCPMWNRAGPGYLTDRKGWLDPSDFIDSHR